MRTILDFRVSLFGHPWPNQVFSIYRKGANQHHTDEGCQHNLSRLIRADVDYSSLNPRVPSIIERSHGALWSMRIAGVYCWRSRLKAEVARRRVREQRIAGQIL